MLKVVVPTLILLLIAIFAMGVKVFCVKGGRFPTGHAHDIPALKKKGIGCAHNER